MARRRHSRDYPALRARAFALILALGLVGGMAMAQPPNDEVTLVSPVVVTPPPAVPTPRTRTWAPNYSVEQTAEQLCSQITLQFQIVVEMEGPMRAFHDATLAAAQTRRAAGIGRATAQEVEAAELARQAAYNAAYVDPYPWDRRASNGQYQRINDTRLWGHRDLVIEYLGYSDTESLWPAKVIEGRVRNTSRRPIYMPPLGYWVADEGEAIVYQNETLPPVEVLGPGEAATFRVKINNPPEHGVRAGVYFEARNSANNVLGCRFQDSDAYNPNQPAEELTRGFNPAITQYGNPRGSAPYSAMELSRLEIFYRITAGRSALEAQRGQQPKDQLDCVAGMSGHWRDFMNLADLASDAYWATRTADHVRREVAEGLREPAQARAADRLRDEAVNTLIAAGQPPQVTDDPTWLLSEPALAAIAPPPRTPTPLDSALYLLATDEGRERVPAMTIRAELQNRSQRTDTAPGIALIALDRKGLVLTMNIQRDAPSINPGATTGLNYILRLAKPSFFPFSNAPPADLVADFKVRVTPAACPVLGGRARG